MAEKAELRSTPSRSLPSQGIPHHDRTFQQLTAPENQPNPTTSPDSFHRKWSPFNRDKKPSRNFGISALQAIFFLVIFLRDNSKKWGCFRRPQTTETQKLTKEK
jgi:hypothetical protein